MPQEADVLVANLASVELRGAALNELAALGDRAEAAVPRLLSLLGSRVDQLRWIGPVLDTLTAIGAASARPALTALREAAEPDAWLYIAVLTELPSEATDHLLITALEDPDARLRARAARTSGRRGEPSPGLLAALQRCLHDPVDRVRSEAGRAIGRTAPAAASWLIALARSGTDASAIAAIEALTEMATLHRVSVAPTDLDALLPELSRYARCAPESLRVVAALLLQKLADEAVRVTARNRLDACMTSEDWQAALTQLLEYPSLRLNSARSIARLCHLVHDVTQPGDVRRSAAALAFAWAPDLMGTDAVILEQLGAGLADPADERQPLYLRALAKVGRRALPLLPPLLEQVRSRDPERCPLALAILGTLEVHDSEILDLLDTFDGDVHKDNYEALIEVLAALAVSSDRAVRMLARHLSGDYASEVALRLGALGARAAGAVPELAAAAWRSTDRDGTFATALGRIGTPAALAALRAMYQAPIGNFQEWLAAENALDSAQREEL